MKKEFTFKVYSDIISLENLMLRIMNCQRYSWLKGDNFGGAI